MPGPISGVYNPGPIFQNPNIRRQAWQAARAGDLSQFLQAHPQAAQRFSAVESGGDTANAARARGMMQGNLRNKQAAPGGSTAGAAPPPGAPPAGGGGPPKTPGGGSSGGAGGGSFQDWLNQQFGSGNPFGAPAGGGAGGAMASGAGGALGNLASTALSNQWYGGSPIATAQQAATQNLQTNLGGIRAQFGQQGLGTSSREALAEGTAAAQMNTQLGAQLAQLGVGARQGDIAAASNALGQQGQLGLGLGGLQNAQANTALNAALGGGQLNAANTANLLNAGQGLTGVGQGEQNIPNMGPLMGFLSAFQSVFGSGRQSQRGSQGWWNK